MLKPVVNMNKMAMNESVATSCCYREVVDVTNIVWKTLYGGYIGTAYKDSLTQTAAAKSSKKAQFALKYTKYDFVGTAEPTNVIWDAIKGEWMFDTLPVDQWAYQWGVTKTTCNHDTDRCEYLDYDTTIANIQHIGATAKHDTAGDSWAKPHEAKQWSS